MSYAIIRIGGRQFKVSQGEQFSISRTSELANEVLLFSDDTNIVVGAPVVEDVTVTLSKVEDKRERKIRVARFKSKSRYDKVKGHRQPVSVLRVESITAGGSETVKPAKKAVSKKVKTQEEGAN
ncbi:50S ribosomal protein L21 [Patescibacteria group bacterium]|nr:50S ribosomal protein L21 [Patescibacteria group bacterium]